MKLDDFKKGIKLFLGTFTISGLLLFSACDRSTPATETIETETDTEADPEAGLGDADGVGIKGSTNTDTVAVDSTTNQ